MNDCEINERCRRRETRVNGLLIIRDTFRAVYARYGAFLRPVLKLLLAFIMLIAIEKGMGYQSMLAKPPVILASSLICVLFPWGFISAVAGAYVVGNMFSVSPVMAAAAAAFGIVVFVLYYGFKPGTGIIISLVPLMFFFKIPFIIPLVLGLSTGIYAAVPAALGVMAWQLIHYFAENEDSLRETGSVLASTQITEAAKQVIGNKYMLITILAFILCIGVVSILSNSSLDNSRVLAVSAGTGILAVLMIFGGVLVGEESALLSIIGLIISYVLAFLYVQVFFSADYSRTERLRYEDDDYYYYVKAVPKIKARD